MPVMDRSELEKLTAWLMDGARSAQTPPDFLKQVCERLIKAGVPLHRVGASVRTLHPDLLGRNFVWRPGEEVAIIPITFDMPDSPQFKSSPLAILYASGYEVRYRLDDPESRRFPFFDDMRAEGVTDYIAMPLLFTDGSVHSSSWTTKVAGGFTKSAAAMARRCRPRSGCRICAASPRCPIVCRPRRSSISSTSISTARCR
jgi:adenylate cyclase